MTIAQVQMVHDLALKAYEASLAAITANPTLNAEGIEVLGHELREWDERLHWSQ